MGAGPLPGSCCPQGPLPAGGPAFSGESREKEHQGAQPPGPPLRKGGSFPKNLFSGGRRLAGGGLFFDDWPAAHSAKGPKASRPPLGRLGALLFSLWGGRKRRNRNDKKKNSGKANMKANMLFAHLPLCAHVCSRRVRTIGASRPIGGRLALGAWRCEGRRPLTPTEPLPFPFAQTREGEREGRNLLPSPPGSRGRSPWCSFVWAFSRESPGPRGSGPLEGSRPPPPHPARPGLAEGNLSPPLWETPEKGRELFFPASPNFDGKYGGFR